MSEREPELGLGVVASVDAAAKRIAVEFPAYRVGADPRTSGPLFFTSREAVAAYAAREGIDTYEVYSVPGGVVDRMKGKPYWIDGIPGTHAS